MSEEKPLVVLKKLETPEGYRNADLRSNLVIYASEGWSWFGGEPHKDGIVDELIDLRDSIKHVEVYNRTSWCMDYKKHPYGALALMTNGEVVEYSANRTHTKPTPSSWYSTAGFYGEAGRIIQKMQREMQAETAVKDVRAPVWAGCRVWREIGTLRSTGSTGANTKCKYYTPQPVEDAPMFMVPESARPCVERAGRPLAVYTRHDNTIWASAVSPGYDYTTDYHTLHLAKLYDDNFERAHAWVARNIREWPICRMTGKPVNLKVDHDSGALSFICKDCSDE
jgi:hypothetical protein